MQSLNNQIQDLTKFVAKYPKLLKRALLFEDRIIVWTLENPVSIVAAWKTLSNCKLRIMPLLPLEGGETQARWNHIWDYSKPYKNEVNLNMRIYDSISRRSP